MTNSIAKSSTFSGISDALRRHPLISLVVIAALLRLLAVIFSKGYMASDDHFVVIQVVWNWLNGIPVWFRDTTPIVRGVVYQYAVFALMWVLKIFGITDPSAVMFINRAVHALWSLTIIPLVYYSLKYFTDDRAAWYGGLLTAIFFLMPFFAVRNMIEVVSQPPLLAGIILVEIEVKRQQRLSWVFWGGILLGAAFMIRIQTAVCPMAVFVVLLAMRRWKQLLWFSIGGLTMLLIEGLIDYVSWGMFLSSVIHTLDFQSKMIHAYVTNEWYTHFLTILGIFIPPFSLLVFPWIVAAAKKLPVSFWTIVAFLVIHSMIPQKQERYLLPILPLLIFLLTAGWSMVKWRDNRIVKGLWTWMWAINLILLPIITLNYSQKARVEPLVMLHHMPNVRKVVVDVTEKNVWLPTYYAQKPLSDFQYIFEDTDYDTLAYKVKMADPDQPNPYTHAIIFNSRDPRAQQERLESLVGNLTLIKHFHPSLADWLLHKSNPGFNHSKESWLYSID